MRHVKLGTGNATNYAALGKADRGRVEGYSRDAYSWPIHKASTERPFTVVIRRMSPLSRILIVILCVSWNAGHLRAQMPFYTDNADVTDAGTLHFEFFNEFDGLQSAQYPDLRQNTANFKLNYGLPHGLELDIDAPYLGIYRAAESDSSQGVGDTDTGIKWNFRKAARPMSAPALSASLYIEFPTGDTRQELGSGLTDYWLNSIAQEPLSEKTRVNANFGFLFAGNTSTGVIGVQTTRGHVYTGGLSLSHDFTSRITLGGEAYAAIGDTPGLAKDQLQGLAGGWYQINSHIAVTFAVLGGSHIASPKIGGQVGFEIDVPLRHASHPNQLAIKPQNWRAP
ncbi:MAG TPA: hypothetical protein VKB38_14345 [Terracidiphilus sp.]|nr:hypothetical protein [Terracidiphilus sp.]